MLCSQPVWEGKRALSPRYLAGAGALLLIIGLLAVAPAEAQERGSASVSIDGTTVKLSTVTYKPTGDGPFPTLIFHHGSGNFDRPYDPRAVAQWFMARGWAVIAPSRRGRGGSEGMNEEGASCSEATSAEGADRALHDIDAMTPTLIAQPFVDRNRIAVAGQSRGGLLSIAWSGKHSEVRAVVNFVGGWVDTWTCRHGRLINRNLLNCGVTWEQPSLWLYGDKDLLLSALEDTKANFDAFWPRAARASGTITCRREKG